MLTQSIIDTQLIPALTRIERSPSAAPDLHTAR